MDDFSVRFTNAVKRLNEIRNTSGSLAKTLLLSQYPDQEFMKRILLYTYNPYYIYGISNKSISELYKIRNELTQVSMGIPDSKGVVNNLFTVLDYLRVNNTGRDIDKRLALPYLDTINDEVSYDYARRILLKDLKIGINTETINKVFKNLIPTFKVMLASPNDDFRNIPTGKVMIQPKLDGVRCIAIITEDGHVSLWTRNGNKIDGYTDIENELADKRFHGLVLDGEIMGSNFDNTMQGLFALDTMKSAIYNVFDVMTVAQFNERTSNKKYSDRFNDYILLFADASFNYVKPVVGIVMESTEFILNSEKVLDDYVKLGYEGIIVKSIHALYEFKRSKSWVKVKPLMTDEFDVVDFEPGKEGTKYEDTLGRIIVSVDGNFVGVGSGFTDEQRDYIWNNQEEFRWKKAEIEYQERTKDNSLRFPVFVKIRNDK